MNVALSSKNEPMIELEYKDESGQIHFQDVRGWNAARQLAKSIAKKTNRQVKLRPAPKRRWTVYLIAIDGSRQVIRSNRQFTRNEAIELWKQWKPIREGSVCILWPEWATPIRIAVTEADWKN